MAHPGRAEALFIGLAAVIGGAMYLTGMTELKLAGVFLVAAGLAWLGALSVVKGDSGVARPTADGVLLPRRRGYAVAVVLALALGSVFFACVSAAAVNAPDYSASYRGDGAVLFLLTPPMLLFALLNGIGALMGRGVVKLTVDEIGFTPMFGRTKTCAWADSPRVDHPDRSSIVVLGGNHRVVIPVASQRWTPATLLTTITGFAEAETPDDRARLIDELIAG